ncbi:MAG: 50S ribosomal protein L5 [Minisyncoccia bacterium]|jgi:large subunit ribosomal protein L5
MTFLRYKERYQKIVIPQMKEEFHLRNDYQVPKIKKVIINSGIGRMITGVKNEDELIDKFSLEIAKITGQKPQVRRARKSISSFKLREGMPIGLVVTLRGQRMADFIDKFINATLPRIRDFWGIPLKNIDEHGNLNYGIKDYAVFPEISKEQVVYSLGLEVTFVVNTKSREKAIRLYELLGFPLNKEEKKK